MIHLALVGARDWGGNFIQSASGISDVEIVVVCRRDTRRRPDGLTEHARVTSDLAAAAEEVDSAIIATPLDRRLNAQRRSLSAAYRSCWRSL